MLHFNRLYIVFVFLLISCWLQTSKCSPLLDINRSHYSWYDMIDELMKNNGVTSEKLSALPSSLYQDELPFNGEKDIYNNHNLDQYIQTHYPSLYNKKLQRRLIDF
ncbi:unnamed protein product [Didymodactylos carnosus]|uniref:Uncharacterized protein n=1 Tax=Didymodactylos carnosus TaxID=1234261 RepID=A0A813W9R5_9BILA|nr:unnamed protein product [Didymodactylos carnosus]CAF1001983.1 unnamed protein product [Didymodactylos carnosus]CAF3645552.1 unnamed protein product [Didymodactylos carnosus]CAF3771384.1 unnamed protein product [Didymodactylos carnosus]